MLVKDLPEFIQNRVFAYQDDQGIMVTRDYDLAHSKYSIKFSDTEEGEFIWQCVNQGNLEPFYAFHNNEPIPVTRSQIAEVFGINKNFKLIEDDKL